MKWIKEILLVNRAVWWYAAYAQKMDADTK